LTAPSCSSWWMTPPRQCCSRVQSQTPASSRDRCQLAVMLGHLGAQDGVVVERCELGQLVMSRTGHPAAQFWAGLNSGDGDRVELQHCIFMVCAGDLGCALMAYSVKHFCLWTLYEGKEAGRQRTKTLCSPNPNLPIHTAIRTTWIANISCIKSCLSSTAQRCPTICPTAFHPAPYTAFTSPRSFGCML
jgi:hypothetical protein